MSRPLAAATLALTLALSAPAHAQDPYIWGEVGEWDIAVDRTISNGCYALATWDSGTTVRIGINPETDFYYVLFGNPSWPPVSPDQRYELEIQFDSTPAWDVTATGLQFNPGELVYYYAQTQIFEFIEDFMRLNAMAIRRDGRQLDRLTLRGSRAAFEAVMECQDEMARTPPPPVAPPPSRGPDTPSAPGKAAQL